MILKYNITYSNISIYTVYKMPKEIVFETINVEDPAQKSRVQFEAKIFNMVNGKEVYADEETGFIFQRYSGFAPKKFNPDPSKRDFVRFSFDPEQKSCIELKSILDNYDDVFEANRKNVFGKYDRLYKFGRSVKQPKSNDEDELSDDDEPKEKDDKDQIPKFETCKMKLKMDWFYYYEGERLDKINTTIVKKAVSDLMIKNKNIDKDKRKALIGTLVFKLKFKDGDKNIDKDVSMGELEQRKEIDTKIFHRRPKQIIEGAEEFLKSSRGSTDKEIDEYESKLVEMFGDPGEPKDVRSPEELDKYYSYNCYVRILFSPFRVWASKSKDDGADKRKSGIKYIINSIDIIQLPYESNNNSSQKIAYSKYAFGKRTNASDEQLLINQSADTVFSAIEKSAEKSTEKKVEKTDKSKTSKVEKKQMKIESEDEAEESEESEEESEEDAEEEAEESESEEEPEPEPPKKTKGKTVVETAKTTKQTTKKTK